MKQIRRNHSVTLAVLALALGGAVYVNWSMAHNAVPITQTTEDGAMQASAEMTGEEAATAVFDPLVQTEETTAEQTALSDKNYGEAQLVSVSKESGAEFFDAAKLSRSKARDQALDTIKTTLKNAQLSPEDKNKVTEGLEAQVNNIVAESGLETLIKAKGFADCVVSLEGDMTSVTVMTTDDALTAAEVAKIRDILLTKCRGMKAENIQIVEVK